MPHPRTDRSIVWVLILSLLDRKCLRRCRCYPLLMSRPCRRPSSLGGRTCPWVKLTLWTIFRSCSCLSVWKNLGLLMRCWPRPVLYPRVFAWILKLGALELCHDAQSVWFMNRFAISECSADSSYPPIF